MRAISPFIAFFGAIITVTPLMAEGASWAYNGFTVHQQDGARDEATKRAIEDQIDIVLSVGLTNETMTFLRSVPLLVVPAQSAMRGTPGLYTRADKAVKITSRIVVVGHKPVLLHELLHAFHDQRLAEGFMNREVLALYARAKAKDTFKSDSHMMKNASEYFACAGTTFLFGVTAQEPFQRAALRKQVELLEFCQRTFGPSCGSYEGTLSARAADQAAGARATAVDRPSKE
jgi:hypothetical protein